MKLEDRIRELIRFRHYSIRTEDAYVGWYRQFVKFHKLRHPQEMGKDEVEAFRLSHDRRRRAAYVAWLEARASADGGRIDEAAMESLRRGWYLGKESFRDKLLLLKKVDRRKVICAAVAKGRTSVSNDWLAERLAMGHSSYVSTLVQRIRRDKKVEKTLRKYERN